MLSYGVRKANTASLFFTLDKQHDVDIEFAAITKRSGGTGDSKNGTLVVRDTAAIQVTSYVSDASYRPWRFDSPIPSR